MVVLVVDCCSERSKVCIVSTEIGSLLLISIVQTLLCMSSGSWFQNGLLRIAVSIYDGLK